VDGRARQQRVVFIIATDHLLAPERLDEPRPQTIAEMDTESPQALPVVRPLPPRVRVFGAFDQRVAVRHQFVSMDLARAAQSA